MLPGPLRVDPNTCAFTETQHTHSHDTFTQPRTHTYHTDLMELPRPSAPHTHTHMLISHLVSVKPVSRAQMQAQMAGRERWAMDIVAEAPLHSSS